MKNVLIALLLLALAGCQTPDREIRADIASKAQEDLNFSGLSYTVKAGVVEFNGRCPSDKALAKIKQKISNIHVIKAVHYHVKIGQVVLDTLTPVRLQTDSLLAQYPQTVALVDTAGMVIKGPVTAQQRTQLISALHKQYNGKIVDSLTVR